MSGFFKVSVETADDTGELLSVYFTVRKGKSHEVREFAEGAAFADYNKKGELLGVEVLGPCKISIVDQIAAEEPPTFRRQAKRFIRRAGPRQLVSV